MASSSAGAGRSTPRPCGGAASSAAAARSVSVELLFLAPAVAYLLLFFGYPDRQERP